MADEHDDSEILRAYSKEVGKAEYNGALGRLNDILHPHPSRSSTLAQLHERASADPVPPPQTLVLYSHKMQT